MFRRIAKMFRRSQQGVPRRLPTGSVSAPALASLVRPEPRDVGALASEMERDYQVQLAVLVLKANIQSVPVTVTTDSDAPRAQTLAQQLQSLWHAHLVQMLDCIGRGRVAFEKCWAYSEAANVNFIEKLDPLPFEQSEMQLDERGRYRGIRLKVRQDEPIELDAEKTWWLALDPTPLEPHGRSRYLGAPQEVWRDRRETRKRLGMFINRFVVRGGVAYAPETETDEYGRVHDAMQITQELIENLYAGGSVVFPNVWVNGPGGTSHRAYEFTESPTTLDPTPLLGVLDAGDTAQLRAFGIPEKTLTEGDSVGSFAMVKQQTLALYAVIEGILSQCVGSFQRYVIDKSIDVNWLPDEHVRIVAAFPKLTERPDGIVSQAVQGLLTAGSTNELVASGAVDLPSLFAQAGIALTPAAQEKLAAFVGDARSPAGRG